MDPERVPVQIRLDRMGHSDIRMMVHYSHVASDDGRLFAARVGRLLEPRETLLPAANA